MHKIKHNMITYYSLCLHICLQIYLILQHNTKNYLKKSNNYTLQIQQQSFAYIYTKLS